MEVVHKDNEMPQRPKKCKYCGKKVLEEKGEE